MCRVGPCFNKVVGLVGRVSVINEAYPVQCSSKLLLNKSFLYIFPKPNRPATFLTPHITPISSITPILLLTLLPSLASPGRRKVRELRKFSFRKPYLDRTVSKQNQTRANPGSCPPYSLQLGGAMAESNTGPTGTVDSTSMQYDQIYQCLRSQVSYSLTDQTGRTIIVTSDCDRL